MGSKSSQQKMTEKNMQYHLRLEHAVVDVAQLIISRGDADLNTVLKILGTAVGANRAYLFQLREDGRKMDNTHEWCSPGTESQIDNLQDLDSSLVPWWMSKLERGEDIVVPQVDNLPPHAHSEKMILQAQDIKSLLVVPITSRRGLLGFLGFDDTEKCRTWHSHDVRILHMTSQMLANEFDRRRAEDQLRESEQKYRALAETNPNPIFAVDQEGRYLYMNYAAAKLLGLRPSDAIGNKIQDIAPERDAQWMLANVLRVFREKSVFQEEQEVAFNNELRYFLTTLAPIFDRSNHVVSVLGIAQDFTDKKNAQEKARRQEAELAHVLRLHTLGEMTSAFAHELNQPLCSILSFAAAAIHLLKSGSVDKAQLAANLERVTAQTERAGEIIRRLRRLSRKTTPHRIEANINELVHNVVVIMQGDIRDNKTKLKLNLAEDMPTVFVDIIQIEQVILNIVRNALEAMDATSPKDRELSIRTSRGAHNTIEVAFRDTGKGLPPRTESRIFDSFFSTKANGLGLGLSLSRSIIESHSGKLCAASHPESGSTFTFTLPIGPKFQYVADQSIPVESPS